MIAISNTDVAMYVVHTRKSGGGGGGLMPLLIYYLWRGWLKPPPPSPAPVYPSPLCWMDFSHHKVMGKEDDYTKSTGA